MHDSSERDHESRKDRSCSNFDEDHVITSFNWLLFTDAGLGGAHLAPTSKNSQGYFFTFLGRSISPSIFFIVLYCLIIATK